MLKTAPAVFAVGNEYQLMVPVEKPSLLWVKVGDKTFYDEQNGILRSICPIHRVHIPQEALDRAKAYTVCERVVIDRCPYFPKLEDVCETTYTFDPLPRDNIRLYHVADAHSHIDEPVAAASTFGNIDLLVMNGDIPNHSGDLAYFDTIYHIAARITGGHKPVVFARGNHDLRGYFAEQMADYAPNQNGNTYYSFRVGSLWGVVLDCAEDKDDSHAEYGGTVCCGYFRRRQTELLQSIVAHKETEYAAEGITHRLVVAHKPFSMVQEPPFDIEQDVYARWCRILKEEIKPDLMLSGHLHQCFTSLPGSERDHLGQPCPLVVGSDIREGYHAGCGITLTQDAIQVVFCDNHGNTFGETTF